MNDVLELEIDAWVRADIPPGYYCDKNGVSKAKNDDDSQQLTLKPVWVDALSRDGSRENWGRLVCWQDHDDQYHKRAVKAGRLHAHGNELAQELADAGLPIVPGKEKELLRYLADFRPKARMIAVTSTGWFHDVFVLPNQIIGESPGERIVLQPPTYHAAADAIYAKGTLKEWQEHIARPAARNPLLRFALSSAFAGPLRFLSGIEAGGFHFYGQTSSGKTTLLQVAGSVFGNSADPAQVGGDNAYLRRWNMTSNAMEGIAEAYNDLPLIIDEISEGDERSFGTAIYRLMGGTGRERADRTGAARKHRSWRGWLLSAGEIPVSQHIDASGQKARGGQLVRLVDVPVDTIFDDAASANQMKEACALYFGAAGPAFIKNLVDDLERLRQDLRQSQEVAEEIGEASTNEEKRVRTRFAFCALAGEMAIATGILPWNKGIAFEACKHTYGLWKQDNAVVSDVLRGIMNVRSFILKHGSSRFERELAPTQIERMVYNRAGWYRDGRYNFTPEAFREACGGVLETVVKKALNEAGWLHTADAPGRLRSTIHVHGTPTHVVSVREAILDEDAEPTEPTSKSGPGSPETTGNIGAEPPEPTEPDQVNSARSGVQGA